MNEARRVDIDRRTWASPSTIVFTYRTKGNGSFSTPQLDFGVSFEGAPFFSYGTSLLSGELVEGDYPFVTIGVVEWSIKEINDEDFEIKKIKPFYTGAKLWIAVSSNNIYDLEHSFSFEGTVLKNPVVT